MWCASRTIYWAILSLLILGLGGCSMHSLSNVDTLTSPHFKQIYLPEASDRSQQIMNRRLTDFIGSFDRDRRYDLSYQLSVASRSALSSAGQSSSLNNTKMAVSYQLRDHTSGTILTSGTIEAFATSGAISSYHGQDVSAQFASERLVKLLAERLYQKLQIYFISLEA